MKKRVVHEQSLRDEYLHEIISNYSQVIVYKKYENDFFLLIDKRNAIGKRLLHELVRRFTTNIQSLYKFCFNSKSYFLDDVDNDNIKYVFVAFSLQPFSITYVMNIKCFLPRVFILDSVCKKKTYGKRMFQHALHFIFSSTKNLSPSRSLFYLSLNLQNPFVCQAFSAYIKAGFVPYEIEKFYDMDHISMVYDKRSKHIRKKK